MDPKDCPHPENMVKGMGIHTGPGTGGELICLQCGKSWKNRKELENDRKATR